MLPQCEAAVVVPLRREWKMMDRERLKELLKQEPPIRSLRTSTVSMHHAAEEKVNCMRISRQVVWE